MKYKKYPKYKESGIEWLGEIPEHWNKTKLRNLGQFTASGIDKKIIDGEELVKIINFTDVFNSNDFVLKQKDYMVVSAPLEKIKAHKVNKGDLIFIPSSETADEIGIAALVDEELENTSYSYHVLRLQFTKNIVHQYKKYLTNNNFVLNQFSLLARGTTRQTLGRDDFKSIIVTLSPLQEQQAIANYLDKATAKIDTLIQKQEKLIELLKEKRQALISHAVTKGLNPDAKMKESGIEWLGKIPEHWEVKKGKYIGKILSTPSVHDTYLDEKGSILYIKVDDLNNIQSFYLSNSKYRVQINYMNTHSIIDFICFPKRGAAIFTNKVCIVNVKSMIDPNLMAWKISPKYDIKYILILLLTRGLSEIADTSTIPQINNKHIEPLKFPIPPISEQTKIVQVLTDKTSKIDELITKATKAIDLLKEKRTALISAAVTGKIDVREEI